VADVGGGQQEARVDEEPLERLAAMRPRQDDQPGDVADEQHGGPHFFLCRRRATAWIARRKWTSTRAAAPLESGLPFNCYHEDTFKADGALARS